MTDILTVTMNPALDVLTTIAQVSHTHKMRCGAVLKHPGGGGVNVARVLHRLGANCVALYLAGGVTGERHHKLMRTEKVRCHVMPIAEETRESFSVHETSSGNDFRFVLPGPQVSAAEVEACFDYVAQHLPKQFLVISGGLAPGVPTDFYARLAALAKAHGVRVVLDTNGPALAEALKVGVSMFKPSLRELRDLTGQDLPNEEAQVAAAQQLIQCGQAEIVAVSLGADGALVISATEHWRARSVKVDVQTTIGAGDSFVGGMVWSMGRGDRLLKAFQYGMASGAAALLAPGTSLSQAADVHYLLPQVVVEAI
ncbi:1-phosphofructokinase family hexose kinase [Limnohabitans sp. INBF002]|uniref:1-phosphofructokinase family hexose kinase n=1 Tax=Limnohabitans sp. INBF002 TaxID=2986280 RepID=UPI0023771384|nr:1-phosphofructokinase family hexose kinase [Limnohabitans sp. INBF002]BDU53803.1 phosphofructokinase [Limnohabitans sp. INBF002]